MTDTANDPTGIEVFTDAQTAMERADRHYEMATEAMYKVEVARMKLKGKTPVQSWKPQRLLQLVKQYGPVVVKYGGAALGGGGLAAVAAPGALREILGRLGGLLGG